MGITLTPAQSSAVTTRDKTLLVSAAAGSGKTATLARRIIDSLIDKDARANISRMLIVTFTRASAADLREKISKELTKALLEATENKKLSEEQSQKLSQHLSKQLVELGNAHISTIDSFCIGILRRFAPSVGISPSFRVADEQGLLLLDLKDLRSMVQYVGENAAALKTKYGNVSAQSVGAIQRALLRLEDQGGNIFFGEPALEIKDWFAQDEKGYGVINMLHCTELFQSPLLYSTFLLWMLSELYESMPEAGDLDKPKMVFFFDEAHLIFKDAPRSLLDKVEQIVRLIRSKGIGIYFITQLPSDIPDSVLSQLGNKLQHALRAYTPKDQKALKVAAQSFRPNPKLDAEAALSELGTGEVLVSLLDEEGIPGIVERAYVMPPRSFLGVAEESKRQEIIKASPLDSKYAKTVDRESAYEVLQKRAEQAAKEAAEEAGEEYVPEDETIQEIRRNSRSTSTKAKKTTTRRTTTKKEPPSMFEKVAEKAATSFGRSIANALARGILGSLLKK